MLAPTFVTPAEVLSALGTAEAPAIVDVCIAEDFDADPYLIPGSFRHAHSDLAGLKDRLQGRPAIIVCQKGLKLSEGVAAWLRSERQDARKLQGGMWGWRDHPGAPRIPATVCPAVRGRGTFWVTNDAPTFEDLAKLWFIRRFIDREARILFVSGSEIAAVCEKFDATPVDALADSGATCTLADMLTRLELTFPPLTCVAARLSSAELAPGIKAVVEGLARLAPTHEDLLDRALPVYDALYAKRAAK